MLPPSKHKRGPDRIIAVESAISKLQDLSKNRHLEDQYDTFGKHVAGQLRELPLRSFVILQEKIQSLITNERLKCMNTLSPLASYVSSVITSPSQPITPHDESDASSAVDDFTSDDTSYYIQL